MTDIKSELASFTSQKAMCNLKEKYKELLSQLASGQGVFIWGTGKLGRYTFEQCTANGIDVTGFIDNDKEKWNEWEKVFSWEILTPDDIVIVASIFYPEIMEQMKSLGLKNYIYYEEFAYLFEAFETYYMAFENIFDELEVNKSKYEEVYDSMADDLSKEVCADIISFKATLDAKHTTKALKLSELEGVQDFDKIVVQKLDKEYTFFDVGGFDGSSTLDYIRVAGEYNKIYFFEPDEEILEDVKEKLKNFSDIIYVNAGVGDKKEYKNYSALGGGDGFFSEDETDGTRQVEMVVLDDFIKSAKSYIKMDIEGYEIAALKGAENAIKIYKPMLSISVYHRPSDLHDIISLILSWNPEYEVFLRHYTNTYADTRAYFVNKEPRI